MKSPDQLPEIARALASDVEGAASDSKRLKLRTLLAKFGYEKKSDSNTAEITNVLSEAGLAVNPPLVRYGESWEISTEDWIYLSIAKESVEIQAIVILLLLATGIQMDGLTELQACC
jgi:hypothetical protein